MSFPGAFRLRDYKLLGKEADDSGWATSMQEKSPLKSHQEVPCIRNHRGSWWMIEILFINILFAHAGDGS